MAGRRRSDRALRAKCPSPGRPGVARREERRRFWALIAAGQSSWEAAIGVGVSEAVGSRWFREAGGMPPSTLGRSSKPPSGRYLSLAEREEIAVWRAQGHGVREVGRGLGRAGSTNSRELRRNAAPRGGGLEYWADRKSTRLNSSHAHISYVVFCLKKKKVATITETIYGPPGNAKTVRSLFSFNYMTAYDSTRYLSTDRQCSSATAAIPRSDTVAVR